MPSSASSMVLGLRKQAKKLGLRNIGKLDEAALAELIRKVDANEGYPPQHRPKLRIGAVCEAKSECYSGKCIQSVCVARKARKLRKNRVVDCPLPGGLELQEHQAKVLRLFQSAPRRKGLLLFHGVGTGKTITALSVAYCLKPRAPKIVVLAPATLVRQWKQELKRWGPRFADGVAVYGHHAYLDRFARGEVSPRNAFLIVDEVHHFRGAEKQVYSQRLLAAAQRAKKVILMSATPLINSAEDIRNMMNMVQSQTRRADEEEVGDMHMLRLARYLKCNVSFVPSPAGVSPLYPKYSETHVKIPMPVAYEREYLRITRKPAGSTKVKHGDKYNDPQGAFYHHVRKACNKIQGIPSPKLTWILEQVRRHPGRKTVIYSAWKQYGVKAISEYLREHGIASNMVHGDMTLIQRNKSVQEFNDGTCPILIISSAGAEGLDLKGTRALVIMEPYWNQARIEQIKGRAIRYKSHEHLPPAQRNVKVYHLRLTTSKDSSADAILFNMAKEKQKNIFSFYKMMAEAAIEEGSNKCETVL